MAVLKQMATLMRPAAWLGLFLVFWGGAAAAASEPLEQQVKAAYLYRFAGFIEWPAGSFRPPDAPIQIGVAGDDALAALAEQMVAGRSIDGHALAVRRVRRGDSLAGLQILYIGRMQRASVAGLLEAAHGQPVLTVSDSDTAATLGCMINLVVDDARLRFEVALRPVTSSGLRISARMLGAARKVEGT